MLAVDRMNSLANLAHSRSNSMTARILESASMSSFFCAVAPALEFCRIRPPKAIFAPKSAS